MKNDLLQNISEIQFLIKHLPGQHNQLEHGRRFKIPGDELSKVVAGPKISKPAINEGEIIKGLEKSLEKKYDWTQFDFQGLSLDYAQRLHDKVEELYTKYPDASQSLHYVGNGMNEDKYYLFDEHKSSFEKEKYKDAFASCNCANFIMDGGKKSKNFSSIMFNSEKTKNRETFEKDLDHSKSEKWGVFETLEGVFAHEFGHMVNHHLFYNGIGKSFLPFIVKSPSGNLGQVSSTTYDWMNKNTSLGETISGYAKVGGPLEQFAESFCALNTPEGDKEHPYTKKLNLLLDAAYGKNGPMLEKNENETVPTISAIPGDPEYEQAKETLNKFYKSRNIKDDTMVEKLMPENWQEELPPGPAPKNWKLEMLREKL